MGLPYCPEGSSDRFVSQIFGVFSSQGNQSSLVQFALRLIF
jgi:hypothetical protein